MEKIEAYKVGSSIYETKEEAEYAELKYEFKPIFKDIEYKFKGINAFFEFFENNFFLIEKCILYTVLYKIEDLVINGKSIYKFKKYKSGSSSTIEHHLNIVETGGLTPSSLTNLLGISLQKNTAFSWRSRVV